MLRALPVLELSMINEAYNKLVPVIVDICIHSSTCYYVVLGGRKETGGRRREEVDLTLAPYTTMNLRCLAYHAILR